MSTENQPVVQDQDYNNEYGYQTDEGGSKINYGFGLNPGKTFLTKFEWIPNGGKDGAEQEAIDIVFNINGTERSYRQFPVVKAFDKNNNEVTDPKSEEIKNAKADLSAKMTHIMHCFVPDEALRLALSKKIASFKDYAQILQSLLPSNFKEIPLDIFMQYQWSIKENQKYAYLEIPKSMKYGKWLTPAQSGKWKEVREADPLDSQQDAIHYVNEKGEIHPIKKNGWFTKSNFANQVKAEDDSSASTAATNMNAGTEGAAPKSAW